MAARASMLRARLTGRWITFIGGTLALLLAAGPARAQRGAFDHSALDSVLAGNLREGRVDYERIAATRLAQLDRYLAHLATADANALTRDEQLAFYLNLYNASMIRAVIARTAGRESRIRPVSPESVAAGHASPMLGQGLRAFWSPADSSFAVFHEPLVRLRSGPMTLDSLEHHVLRARFHEPRMHVALVCAARSCPPLLPRAYRGRDLDSTLAANLRAFAADPSRNRVNESARRLMLSEIFEWYADDFAPQGGAAAVMGRALGRDFSGWSVTYLKYDWTLNDLAR